MPAAQSAQAVEVKSPNVSVIKLRLDDFEFGEHTSEVSGISCQKTTSADGECADENVGSLSPRSLDLSLTNLVHPFASPTHTPKLDRIPQHGLGAEYGALRGNFHPTFVIGNRFPCHALSWNKIEALPNCRRNRHLSALCHCGCNRFHMRYNTSGTAIMSTRVIANRLVRGMRRQCVPGEKRIHFLDMIDVIDMIDKRTRN
jgi:hypothetical protein